MQRPAPEQKSACGRQIHQCRTQHGRRGSRDRHKQQHQRDGHNRSPPFAEQQRAEPDEKADVQSGNGHQMAETRNAERGLVGVAQIFAAADQQSGQQSGFAFRKGTLHRISAEPCDPLRRKAQAIPLGI